jgi:hypothetical protein
MTSFGWKRKYRFSDYSVTNSPLKWKDLLQKPKVNIRFTLFVDRLYEFVAQGLDWKPLDLYRLAYAHKGKPANWLLDRGVPVRFVYPPVEVAEDTCRMWYARNREVIDGLQLKYPGMFVLDCGKKKKKSLGSFGKRRRTTKRRRKVNSFGTRKP